MAKRSDMPTKAEIVEYWSDQLIEMDIEDEPVDESSCFVCGSTTRLQRSHILALCEGGSNALDNLHLLCRQCHDESEFLSGEVYWRWYKDKRVNGFISPFERGLMKIRAYFPDLEELNKEYDKLDQLQQEVFVRELVKNRLNKK